MNKRLEISGSVETSIMAVRGGELRPRQTFMTGLIISLFGVYLPNKIKQGHRSQPPPTHHESDVKIIQF
jgi:hypothetical protein